MQLSIKSTQSGLRVYLVLILSAVLLSTVGYATPINTPFLSVDIDGNSGPTQSGWSSFPIAASPSTDTFSDTIGSYDVTITGINNAGTLPDAVDRGGPTNTDYLANVYRDFVYVAHDSSVAFGRDYIAVEVDNLNPNAQYEVTVYDFDQNHSTPYDNKFMAWSDVNPAQWLDENVGMGESYNPGTNPIPTLDRVSMAGAWPEDPCVNDPYAYSGSFFATTDANGTLYVWGWADLETWEGTQYGLLNGFQLGAPVFTWDGNSNNNWSDANNWFGGTAPADGTGIYDTLVFGPNDTGDQTITGIDGTYTNVEGIDFSGATAGYSLSGDGDISIDAGGTIGGDSGFDHIIDVGLITNTGGGIDFNNTDNITVSDVISGSGGVTQSGNSTLTLSGTNTYTGGTTMSTGTIVLGNDSALGTGSLSVTGDSAIQSNDDSRAISNAAGIDTGATLTVSGTNNLVMSGVISGDGGLAKSGTSSLTLSGASTYSGGTTLSAGTVLLGNNSALGSGILTVSGDSTVQSDDDSRVVGNDVSVGAGNTLTLSGTNNFALTGDIDGDGALTKEGTSNLTLSGTNSYIGGTTVTAGTLTGTTNSLQGDITNNAAIVFGQSATGTYADIISGTGTVTKSGAGTLTLSGNNTYTGLTTLSAGTLNIGGQVFGDVDVDGGTLMGTGTIANDGNLTINSGGTFAPGNSIGTMTVTGDFVLGSGSTLEIEVEKEIDDDLDNDLVDVAGAATLESGSTINVTDVSPSVDHYIDTNDQFTIITTVGGITDGGVSITDTSATLSFTGSISGSDYILTATRAAFTASAVGRNNLALLGAIQSDMDSASGDYLSVINLLSNLGVGALNNAAERLSPLSHSSISAMSTTLIQDMGSDISGYLLARRNNTEHMAKFNTLKNSDLLLADASGNPETLGYVISETEKRRQQRDSEKQTNTFFRPFGVFFNQDSNPKFVGFQGKSVGAQFGVDKVFGTNWIIGIGGAYSHSRLDFDKGYGNADIDSFRVGPYATYFKDRVYVDTSISLGYHLNRVDREIQFPGLSRTAESDYDAYDISAYIGAGYEYDLKDWILTPTTSLRYTCYRNESFKESGAGAAGLDVDARTQESLLSRLGLRLHTIAQIDTMTFVPEFFVGYAHEFIDEDNIDARFIDGSAKFSTDVDSNRDDSVYFGAGISSLLNNNTSAFVRYQGEASGNSRSTSLQFGLTMKF